MSLINEALKKAQQAQSPQESRPPPPSAGLDRGYTPPAPVSPSEGGHGNLLKALVAGMALMAVFAGAGAFLVVLFLRSGGEPREATVVAQAPAVETAAPAAAIRTEEPAPRAAQPVAPPAPAAPAEPDTVLGKVGRVTAAAEANREGIDEIVEAVSAPPPQPQPAAQPAPDPPDPVVSQPDPAAAAPQPAPVQALQPAYTPRPLPPPQPPAPAAPVSNPAITDWVEKIEIQGIKLAGSNSKVLMDNKVFRINSVVNRDFDLKVKEIKKSEIVFIDNVGVIYTKFF